MRAPAARPRGDRGGLARRKPDASAFHREQSASGADALKVWAWARLREHSRPDLLSGEPADAEAASMLNPPKRSARSNAHCGDALKAALADRTELAISLKHQRLGIVGARDHGRRRGAARGAIEGGEEEPRADGRSRPTRCEIVATDWPGLWGRGRGGATGRGSGRDNRGRSRRAGWRSRRSRPAAPGRSRPRRSATNRRRSASGTGSRPGWGKWDSPC